MHSIQHLNISELKAWQLSEIMPEVFSEGRVHFDKLKAAPVNNTLLKTNTTN
ncbi:MAG: hypothetical protein Q8T08_22710 [Ignavibacteria bacterium]|nr:hypothetical protein [Ignavibacteria bacterium]